MRQLRSLPDAVAIFRKRLEGVVQAFLAMAGATSSADFPYYPRRVFVNLSGRAPTIQSAVVAATTWLL